MCQKQIEKKIHNSFQLIYLVGKKTSRSVPTKTMTASASLGILARSFIDLAAAGWVSGGSGWRDFLGGETEQRLSTLLRAT